MSNQHSNRLIHETSPYLLQHAHNPVDWFPWCPEAFDKARRENKPVLLSIGYSACHWCHVMAHESFENERIAAVMNEHFVSIKVDREERPDLDHIYQNVVQMLSGQGGWPLTMFLTPEQEPFYGGTYFPPEDRYGRPGFPRMLSAVAEAYHQRPDEVTKSIQQIRENLHKLSTFESSPGSLSLDILTNAMRSLANNFDMVHGGFGTQPKFPNPSNLECFLRYWHFSGNENFLNMVKLALQKMAGGGIYDHLGGGFHRYSVDDRWRIPHFEKMLYDNAQLLPLYVNMYQITHDEQYAQVARETLAYLQREMLRPGGGFYATQDADSEGEEGKFFAWTKAEVDRLLGDASRLFCRYYDVTGTGNWEHGKNILHLTVSQEQLAKMFNQSLETTQASLEAAKATLFATREQRVKPFRDEKILTAWNGLMLSGIVQAYAVLGDAEALQAVRETIAFLQQHMWHDGRLLSVYKDGQAKFNAYLDDYALLTGALLDAFEVTAETSYFLSAQQLAQTMLEEFWDREAGGFFFTGESHETLIERTKSAYDQAMPAGMSIATRNLLRLYHYTGNPEYLQKAEQVLHVLRRHMEQQPFGVGSLLTVLDFYLQKPQEIVLIGVPGAPDTAAMLHAIHQQYLPNKMLVQLDPRAQAATLDALPLLRDVLAGKGQVYGTATVYVCHNFTCSLPVTEPAALSALLAPKAQTP
ncbi:MAG: thioredoxin domain-containing protein [Candidatus Tectomicrobia bacterium]|uniref:Thioredoxin domain-containing protein n=1 Tax=Tectimicrobiota bacterium TaxID=2528274 RepID=A0A937W4F2_UNCTE|nr:thioredoxin domain-containing protein [Candidatus Tectomicrobia bacterium]